MSVLEASYLIFFLPPWHENYQKRLVKSPKLYFYDCGLAGYLAGITSREQWQTHPLRGAFFETMVVSEQIKRSAPHAVPSRWYFWSSPSGLEVDLVEQKGQSLSAYEIKASATFRPEHTKNLLAWGKLAGVEPSAMQVLYAGDETFHHQGLTVRPWCS